MSINFHNLVNTLNKWRYPLLRDSSSQLAQLSEITRVFELRKGERIHLVALDPHDYLHVAEGLVRIRGEGVEERTLASLQSHLAPFEVPENCAGVEAEALGDTTLYHIDRDKLDYLLFWNELRRTLGDEDAEIKRRMDIICHSAPFRRLPLENVHEAIRRCSVREVSAGDEIVRQGAPGDMYYIIEEGKAEVWRMELYDDAPQKVNILGPGDAFGEEALVSKGTRNATVRMIEDGKLLVLNQKDFDELVSNPMVQEVKPEVARNLLNDGYALLDVRYQEEYEESHIPGCQLVPLHAIRSHMPRLDRSRKYIVYCRSGKRSAVATLLLRQGQIDAVSLKGGISGWPYEVHSGRVA